MSNQNEFTIGNSPENTYQISNPCKKKIHLHVVPLSAVEYIIHNHSDNQNLIVDRQPVIMARVDKFTPLQLGEVFFTLGELIRNRYFLSHHKSFSNQFQTEYTLERGKIYLAGASDQCDIMLPSPRVAWQALEIKSLINQWEIYFISKHKKVIFSNGIVLRLGPYQLKLNKNGQLKTFITTKDCLTIRNLEVLHPKKRSQYLIRDFSLSIQAGEFMGIIGPSGAGKSTLLKAIRSIIPIKAGQIHLSHQDTRQHPDILKEIGFVPQDDVVIPELTVEENLRFATSLRLPADWSSKAIEQIVNNLLDSLKLEKQRDSYCANISGGERKRVNLALELMLEPSFLLADEVCTGLSSLDTDNILQHLRQIADHGKGIMLTIHSPDIEAFDLMDTLLVLDIGGLIAYYGPAQPDAIQYFARREHSPYKSPKLIFDVLEKKSVITGERQTSAEQWHYDIYRNSHYYHDYIAAKLVEQEPGDSS